jgi:glycosyltransferase involved in cell wall biosynthesis
VEPSLTVIVPTCGRPTLAQTLASIKSQRLLPWDRVLVVGDGEQPDALRMLAEADLPVVYYYRGPKDHRWGYAQRNAGMRRARLTFQRDDDRLLFMDDDDEFVHGAFDLVRGAAKDHPDRLLIFSMQLAHDGSILPDRTDGIYVGQIGVPCICVPNRTDLPQFELEYGPEVKFVNDCVTLLGQPVWVGQVIARVWQNGLHPEREGRLAGANPT